MAKVLVLLSGGMDSSTLAYLAKANEHQVQALSINYGQKHARELHAGHAICRELGIGRNTFEVSDTFRNFAGESSLLNPAIPVPHGHYADESMKATVVPNRNMILLALATAYAVSQKFDMVAYACHAGDHTIYPDCRPEFVKALGKAIGLADWHKVKLVTPFLNIVFATAYESFALEAIGLELNVPYDLTYSCYEGGETHCGKCGTCVEREEALTDSAQINSATRHKLLLDAASAF